MSVLQVINALMHPGTICPGATAIGECAAIFPVKGIPDRYEAEIYIWQRDFNDSTMVAGWFAGCGATDIWISYTLYSDANDDRDGSCFGEGEHRHWSVSYTLLEKAQAELAVPVARCAKCEAQLTPTEAANGCPYCGGG